MALRSPTQVHAYWGAFANAAAFPNVPASPTPASVNLEAGDTAYSAADGLLYVCIVPTVGAAVWEPMITPPAHKSLRDLIHFIDDGPADGFASGAYKQTFYDGALIIEEIWWESAALTQRIVDLAITYAGSLPTVEVWRMYDEDGVTVLVTLTDAITYSGALEQTRTRTWV